MKPSESKFLDVRGLRYHCRVWGATQAPVLILLHGWMDVSASFQFFVDALRLDRYIVAPDWRGFGLTQWSGADSYWFPDYLGDLEAIVNHFSAEMPVDLAGHSLGGNVAAAYAGIRPVRVRRLINIEGFGLRRTEPSGAPARYARWLEELGRAQGFREYASFAELEQRLCEKNPRLAATRAAFLARHWGEQTENGRVRLRSDPAHRRVNPVQYQLEEARACWSAVTAPVLWVEGSDTQAREQMRLAAQEIMDRKSAFADLRTVIISGAGHMIHHDQPEALAAAIEDFLRS